jgi:hypothetical protein
MYDEPIYLTDQSYKFQHEAFVRSAEASAYSAIPSSDYCIPKQSTTAYFPTYSGCSPLVLEPWHPRRSVHGCLELFFNHIQSCVYLTSDGEVPPYETILACIDRAEHILATDSPDAAGIRKQAMDHWLVYIRILGAQGSYSISIKSVEVASCLNRQLPNRKWLHRIFRTVPRRDRTTIVPTPYQSFSSVIHRAVREDLRQLLELKGPSSNHSPERDDQYWTEIIQLCRAVISLDSNRLPQPVVLPPLGPTSTSPDSCSEIASVEIACQSACFPYSFSAV